MHSSLSPFCSRNEGLSCSYKHGLYDYERDSWMAASHLEFAKENNSTIAALAVRR